MQLTKARIAPTAFTASASRLGKIDHYTFDIAFSGNAADIALNERTGLMREIVRAIPAQQP